MSNPRSRSRLLASLASAPVLAACILSAALLLRTPSIRSAAHAQGPEQEQGGPPPGQGFGGPGGFGGQGGPGGPGGPGGFGPGGMQMRMPFLMGAVKGIDPSNSLVAVSTPFGGDDVVARIGAGARIVKQVTAKVSEVKAGDTVQVQGIPTGITASNLTIGQAPDLMRGGFGGPGAAGPAGVNAGRRTQPQAFAMASGKVTSTSPLTIALSDTASVTLKLAANATISKFAQISLSDVKVGDRIMLSGQMGDDGAFAATGAAVNLGMGGPGFGGPMMGPGGPGFRGPGGPGGGQGAPQNP